MIRREAMTVPQFFRLAKELACDVIHSRHEINLFDVNSIFAAKREGEHKSSPEWETLTLRWPFPIRMGFPFPTVVYCSREEWKNACCSNNQAVPEVHSASAAPTSSFIPALVQLSEA